MSSSSVEAIKIEQQRCRLYCKIKMSFIKQHATPVLPERKSKIEKFQRCDFYVWKNQRVQNSSLNTNNMRVIKMSANSE